MHIAIVTTFPPGKGSLNEYAFHFVRWLRRKPEVERVTLLVDELPEGEAYADDDTGAPLRFVTCWRFGALDNALRIQSAVRREAPDAVLFNIQFASFGRGKRSGALGLLAPALVQAAGFPSIVLLHNIMETVDLKQAGFGGSAAMERAIRFAGEAATRALLRADLVALTIPKYVELLERKYGASNVILAPHGAFDPAPPPPDPPADPLQIMTFGKFGTYKRVEPLIEAFQTLAAPGRPRLELVIAGTDSPNAPGYLDSLRARYADVRGLRFTGYVAEEDVPRIFGEAAMVVLPYTSTTGSSGVLHQCGDYARAVVLPKVGDLAELIAEEGYAGELFEPGDTASLAAAMARLVDDPARRKELGMRNYMAANGLPMAEVVDWYILHLQRLIGGRAQAAPRRSATIA
jgi:glycosyltransferase involved in cell wall biosynthesis